jgi:hypothetical protein
MSSTQNLSSERGSAQVRPVTKWPSYADDPFVVVPRSRPDTRVRRQFDRAVYVGEREAAVRRGAHVARTALEQLRLELGRPSKDRSHRRSAA